jgi:putative inorganic carbon (hco3(-)) transporter
MRLQNNLTYYAVILSLFFVPLVAYKTYIGPLPLSIEVVTIPLLTVAAVIDYLRKRITLNDLNMKPMLAAFLLFFVIGAISLVKAVSLAPGMMELARYLSYVVLFTIVVKVKFTREQYLNFAKVFGASVAIVGIYGVVQYIFGISLNTAGLYALKEAKGRVDSTLINPNYYASFLNLVIPTLVLLAVVYFKDKKAQLLMFAFYGIYVINLILTYTRAAWVTMACGFILMVMLIPKDFIKNALRPHILLSFVALMTIVYFMPDVQSRTSSAIYAMEKLVVSNLPFHVASGDNSQEEDQGGLFEDEQDEDEEENAQDAATTNRAVVSRVTLWKTGWVMLKENPVLGVGMGNYLVRYKEYVTKYPELYIGHDQYSVHNSYLKVGAETGFIGLAAFLLVYIVYYLYLIRLYFAAQNRLSKVLAIGLIVGSLTFMVQNLSNNLIFIPQLNTVFWLVSGLVIAFLHQNQEQSISMR